jgi:cell division septation protein DedD
MATTPNNPLASGDTAALYRAAIGPRGQDYYLRHFTRFDADGKAGTSWNWAAYWSTFNWLVYRKMGARALAYLGTLLACALLVFGLGKVVLNYSDATAILLALALLTAAFVVPGLYGNAWFYNHCNRRITDALRHTQDLKEAAALLALSAPNPKRLMVQGVLNAAMLALLFGAVQWLQTPEGNLADLAPPATPMADGGTSHNKAAGRVTEGTNGNVNGGTVAEATPSPASPTVASPAAPDSSATPAAPTSTTPPTPAPVTARANEAALVPTADKPNSKPSKAEPAAAAVTPPAKPATAATQAAATASPAASASNTDPRAADPASTAPATPAAPARATPRVRYVWVLQVGAYAQEENARRALTQVQSLGLEAGAETFSTAQGSQLMRVRVGPFTRQAEAEQAAVRIKSLDLPVLLLRQRP